jgi:hypothetical protein
MQKDCHHFSVVNEHAIFTQFFEIMEIRIRSLVLPYVGNCASDPYHLPHGVRDTVPFVAKMPDDPSTLTGTPIFRRM